MKEGWTERFIQEERSGGKDEDWMDSDFKGGVRREEGRGRKKDGRRGWFG